MCDRIGRESFSDVKDNNIKIYLPEMREFVFAPADVKYHDFILTTTVTCNVLYTTLKALLLNLSKFVLIIMFMMKRQLLL